MSKGYLGSDQMLDQMYIDGCYKIGDGIAKEIGLRTFIIHFLYTRSKRAVLWIYYKYIWNGTLTWERK